MDSTDQYPIYLGVWTNWSRGATMGSTLTMHRTSGSLLIAFVAFFVAFVANRFWRILCLVLHFVYSTQDSQDALYHQRQVILRNSASAESGLLSFLYVLWAWRRHTSRRHVRLLLVIALALVSAAGFAVASGFSSRVSAFSGSTEVLVDGRDCRRVNWAATSTAENSDTVWKYFYPYLSRAAENWANYAEQCHGTNMSTTRLLGCATFVSPRLPLTIDTHAGCPFDPKLCKSQDQNIMIDTGYMDSHEHLGLNAPPQERFQYRRILHCAPLVTEGYTSTFTNSSSKATYTRYHYGQMYGVPYNFTYEYVSNARALRQSPLGQFTDYPDYNLGVKSVPFMKGTPVVGVADFTPIPELWPNSSADLSMFFVSSRQVRYLAPVLDPIYHATTPNGVIKVVRGAGDPTVVTIPIYGPDEAAAPLGCTERYQICDLGLPEGARCGPLAADFEVLELTAAMFPDRPEAQARIAWALSAAGSLTGATAFAVKLLASRASTARHAIASGISGPLPDNQWMLDVISWHDLVMVGLQGGLVRAATGPTDDAVLPFFDIVPENDMERAICNNIKVLSTAYVSFSMFGLLFIFILGGLLIATSIVLDPLFSFLRARYGMLPYKQLEWRTHDALQLHRLAHEEIGAGNWSGGADMVPLTHFGDKLAALDISNLEHPRLRKQPSESTDVEKGGVRVNAIDLDGTTDSVFANTPTTTHTNESPATSPTLRWPSEHTDEDTFEIRPHSDDTAAATTTGHSTTPTN